MPGLRMCCRIFPIIVEGNYDGSTAGTTFAGAGEPVRASTGANVGSPGRPGNAAADMGAATGELQYPGHHGRFPLFAANTRPGRERAHSSLGERLWTVLPAAGTGAVPVLRPSERALHR